LKRPLTKKKKVTLSDPTSDLARQYDSSYRWAIVRPAYGGMEVK
jgi:hypothetical protein